jgi:SHAQKYF class myb-like DNA-binding protein
MKDLADTQRTNTGKWNTSEHKSFLEGIELYGKKWKLVAGYVSTRNSTQVRSHAQKYFLNKLSSRNEDKINRYVDQSAQTSTQPSFYKYPQKNDAQTQSDSKDLSLNIFTYFEIKFKQD